MYRLVTALASNIYQANVGSNSIFGCSSARAWLATSSHLQKGQRKRLVPSTPDSAVSSVVVLHHRSQADDLLGEAINLIQTVTGLRRSRIHPLVLGRRNERALQQGAAFRSGHLSELRAAVAALGASDVVINLDASGAVLSRVAAALEKDVAETDASKVRVKDRTRIVLDVFKKHAGTAEAQLQVQLAELRYQKARLVRRVDAQGRLVFGVAGDEREVVSARGRGGVGTVGGSGEQEINRQTMRIKEEIARVQRKLSRVRKHREMLRAARKRDGHVVCALVGYTNAGKSAMMRALSGQEAGEEDKLFATLDTRVRGVRLDVDATALFVDTVGFIQDLPMDLVLAFRATLDEALQAAVLVHIVDISSPVALRQRATVLSVLQSLGLSKQDIEARVLEVWNKADRVPHAAVQEMLGSIGHACHSSNGSLKHCESRTKHADSATGDSTTQEGVGTWWGGDGVWRQELRHMTVLDADAQLAVGQQKQDSTLAGRLGRRDLAAHDLDLASQSQDAQLLPNVWQAIQRLLPRRRPQLTADALLDDSDKQWVRESKDAYKYSDTEGNRDVAAWSRAPVVVSAKMGHGLGALTAAVRERVAALNAEEDEQ